ncbi:MAG: PEP-CTERM sorting domain-containing protein [Terriglobales bacterium]
MNRYSKVLLTVVLLVAASGTALADDIGFTGNYAPGNFTFNNNGGNGSVNTSGAPGSIVITGNNAGGSYVDTTFLTTAAYTGQISFNWSYATTDSPGWDYAFYVVVNGQNILASSNGGSGSITFNINAGDTFGFGVGSVDGIFGPGVLTISNFQSTSQVPEPASMFLLGTGLVAAAGSLRKRFAKA